ncbi:hypothetical protein GY12_06085, partial [Micrococcus luteus]
EVAVGCTVGILIGDLLMVGLGRGLWQASVVLFVSVMVARFLDSGATFTMQMSLQSVLVVLLPIGAGGPFVRSQDAIVGGVLALLVTFLSPQDVRRPAVRQLGGLYDSIATVLRDLSPGPAGGRLPHRLDGARGQPRHAHHAGGAAQGAARHA